MMGLITNIILLILAAAGTLVGSLAFARPLYRRLWLGGFGGLTVICLISTILSYRDTPTAQDIARETAGGDSYAFLEIDTRRPLDSSGNALLMVSAHGANAIPVVQWHVYPPESKSDTASAAYLRTYSNLGGARISLIGGPFNVGGIRPGNYAVDFTASNGNWNEDFNITEKDGKLSQEVRIRWNGKVFSPLGEGSQQ